MNSVESSYIECLEANSDLNLAEEDDKYSGIFLALPFEKYWRSKLKVMIVGRETAGWNTKNGLNGLNRVVEHSRAGMANLIVDEAFNRYSWHLLDKPGGKLKTKHRSHFQHYYNSIAKQLGVHPESLIYANLFAFDYDGASIEGKPANEDVKRLSCELLSILINYAKPDVIVFAVGCNKNNDLAIKSLMNTYYGGYQTQKLIPKQFWKFISGDMTCYRVSHPRAKNGNHPSCREMVITDLIKLDRALTE
ncbi:hypothetical protein [Vibrio owensii]|uniref:hypothetical protein n=1 Tax=Vibrio owensii TaxID=696485 RepID=UPI003CC52C44